MKKTLTALLLLTAATNAGAGYDVATFGDTGLINGVGQHDNNSGGFTSGSQSFSNVYNPTYGSWNGFSVSSTTDTTTPGYTNQYSSITGGGNGDAYYAVLYPDAYVNLTGNAVSIDLTNTTYAYLSMLNGDQFARKFAAGDYFKVVITGYTGQGETGTTTGSVTFNLANYTSDKSTPVDTWNTVSLTSLGSAASLGFSFLSSDVGPYGINTPTYVAVDNLVTDPPAVPEPSSLALALVGLGIGIGAWSRRIRLARSAAV